MQTMFSINLGSEQSTRELVKSLKDTNLVV